MIDITSFNEIVSHENPILHTDSDEIKKRKVYARPSFFDLNASNYIFLTFHDVNDHI